MMLDENTNSVIQDIQSCLKAERIDQMLTQFLYIYHQLDTAQQKEHELFAGKTERLLGDAEWMQRLDFYYSLAHGEEARLLFDPRVTYSPVYDMESFADLYKELLLLRRQCAKQLGIIRKSLGGSAVWE
jgi:hypothetical protein